MYIIRKEDKKIIHLASNFENAINDVGCYLNGDYTGLTNRKIRVKLEMLFFRIFGRLSQKRCLWIYKHTINRYVMWEFKNARIITIGEDYIYTSWAMTNKEVEMLYSVTKEVL